MNARDEVERQLIAAAAQKRLPEACQTLLDSRRELSDDAARFVERVRDACVAIGEASVRTQNALLPALRAEGVEVRVPSGCDNGRPRQFAYLELEADRRGLYNCLSVLRARGFTHPATLHFPGLVALCHFRDQITLTAADAAGTRLIIRWKPEAAPSMLGDRFRPGLDDVNFVKLPVSAWWLYGLVPVIRTLLVRARLAGAPSVRPPYLATPTVLAREILEFAEVRSDDVVLDLGCGDGRVLFEAVKQFGCRAIGVERDPVLLERARTTARERKLEKDLELFQGDFHDINLDRASVVFVFLPAAQLKSLVPKLLQRLAPGSRIVAHELEALDVNPAPQASSLIFGPDGITVAHCWYVAARD